MKTAIAIGLAALALQAAPLISYADDLYPQDLHAGMGHQQAKIAALLKHYEDALNASDVNGVVQLYTDDGVVMAPDAPAAIGIQAVRDNYAGTFQAVSLKLNFEIEEIICVAPDWAVLRSHSSGTLRPAGTTADIPAAYKELFLMHKDHRGQWRIARYSFSSTLPAAK